MANQTNQTNQTANANKPKFNVAELLKLADTQANANGTRKANTCRLYESGRINIANGSGIVAGTNYTAKIADSTLIIYADANSKRKANAKTNSSDVLFNLVAELRKRTAYQTAVANSKVAGCKEFKDYDIITQTVADADYYIIDLNQHAQTKPNANSKPNANANTRKA